MAKSLKKHSEGRGVRFVELHSKSDAGTLVEFVSHWNNRRAALTQVYKTACRNLTRVESHAALASLRVMIFNKVYAVTASTFLELSDTTSYSPNQSSN